MLQSAIAMTASKERVEEDTEESLPARTSAKRALARNPAEATARSRVEKISAKSPAEAAMAESLQARASARSPEKAVSVKSPAEESLSVQ
mgnify:CR=1 FL=1